MKTSEFIRTSVSRYMATSLEDFNRTDKWRWLCHVFEGANIEWKLEYPELWELLRSNTSKINVLLTGCGTEDDNHYILRIMFAEFMALYFEDLGD